jgi:hypothetical protein
VIIVPPVGVIAERGVAAHMRRYGAVTPDKPMGYAPARFSHARALRRLRAAGVVRGGDTALWLDQAAWDQRQAKRRKRAMLGTAVLVAGAGLASLTTLRG